MFYERAVELLENATSLNDKINQTLCNEFGMSSDKVSRTFKSYFGKTIREALKDKLLPSRKEIEDALIKSNNVNEMKSMLGISKTSAYWKGLLDREFGYSTYEKAKAKFISQMKVSVYNPSLADNESLIFSQILGDGSYDYKRGAIRIEHGYKQYDYLKLKVALFKKAFPEVNGIEKITKRVSTVGYESYRWYSKRLGTSYTNKIENTSKMEMINRLTPLGWFLYYFDDGFLSISSEGQHICGFSIVDKELQSNIVENMELLGVSGWTYDKSFVALRSHVGVATFLKNIIFPFKPYIPECMEYKLDMKI